MKTVDVGVRPDISQLLGEMRAMRERAGFQSTGVADDLGVSQANGLDKVNSTESTNSFGNLLNNAINQVNEVQKESGKLQTAFQQGDPDATLTEVVIASEKASIAFEAMTEVRNRLVNAYEDIMNMPI